MFIIGGWSTEQGAEGAWTIHITLPTMRCLALVVFVLLAVLLGGAAGKHPHKLPYEPHPCLSTSTADADVCYPTRCRHLFAYNPDGSLTPTPKTGYPQDHTDFRCKVEEFEEYAGYTSRKCKKATCVCLDTNGDETAASCNPAVSNHCLQHRC